MYGFGVCASASAGGDYWAGGVAEGAGGERTSEVESDTIFFLLKQINLKVKLN